MDRLTVEEIQTLLDASAYIPDKDLVQIATLGNYQRCLIVTSRSLYTQLIDTMRENERLRAATLLAARWFKLYQEDKTRYEHPASDADLLGMFDAMQTARLQPNKDTDHG